MEKSEREKIETNEIFIGNKPFMKYVIASLIQIKMNENSSIVIKARGKFISKAVDVAEVVKKKLVEENTKIKEEIKINTDEFMGENEKKVKISTIDVIIKKA